MKKAAISWAAAGMLAMEALSLASCAGIKPRTDYRVVSNLVVNIDGSYANVTHKGEKEGIRDMRKLVEDPYYEEAWVFLPDEFLWIETGFGEVRYPSDVGEEYVVNEMVAELESIFAWSKNVVEYHIHLVPSSLRSKMIAFYVNMAASPMPKYRDIPSMITESDIFYKLQPEGSIISKICSHYGVTEYFLTEKGKRRFAGASRSKKILSEAVSFSNEMYSKLNSKYPVIEKQLWDCVKESMEKKAVKYHGMERLLISNEFLDESYESCAARMPYRLAEEISNEYVKVRFIPYEQIFAE